MPLFKTPPPLAVSILAVKDKNFVAVTKKALVNRVRSVHYDVMDKRFVPNEGFSPAMVRNCVKTTKDHFVDVHLMVDDPDYYISRLAPVADLIVFHHEAVSYSTGKKILKNKQTRFGVAVNPTTNIEQIYEYLWGHTNYILVMGVVPGKGGQAMLPQTVARVAKLRQYAYDHNLDVTIGVDGGVNNQNAPLLLKAGANVLVVGSYLTNNIELNATQLLKITNG